MEQLVNELKKLLDFKDTTDIGDIVLVASTDPQFLVFALVTDIERDPGRKDEWWHLHLSVLSIPIQKLTWTLRTPQMCGMEIFTMDGKKRFVKAVDMGGPQLRPVEGKTAPRPGGLKRIK